MENSIEQLRNGVESSIDQLEEVFENEQIFSDTKFVKE